MCVCVQLCAGALGVQRLQSCGELKLESVVSLLTWVLELNSGPVEEQISFLTAEQTLVLRKKLLFLSVPVMGAALH